MSLSLRKFEIKRKSNGSKLLDEGPVIGFDQPSTKPNKLLMHKSTFFQKFTVTQVQVNLCQKLLFMHQLTHNMTTDCSLNYKFNT